MSETLVSSQNPGVVSVSGVHGRSYHRVTLIRKKVIKTSGPVSEVLVDGF